MNPAHTSSDTRVLFTDGLTHSDRFVRQSCLNYWRRQPDKNREHTQQILKALETFGISAYENIPAAHSFPLEPDCCQTLRNLLETLPGPSEEEMESRASWYKWLERADFEIRQTFDKPTTCWQQIEQTIEGVTEVDDFPGDAVEKVTALLQSLVEQEDPEILTDRARSWLEYIPNIGTEQETHAPDDVRANFKFGFGVILAGKLRMESAVERIVDGYLTSDWDWLLEISLDSLIAIGRPCVCEHIHTRWSELPDYAQLYLASVFEVMHPAEPRFRDFYLENLKTPHAYEVIPPCFAIALALIGDPDSIRVAAEFWDKNGNFELARTLYAQMILRGIQNHQLEAIHKCLLDLESQSMEDRKDMRELKQYLAPGNRSEQRGSLNARSDAQPVAAKTPKVGRNEPCPCGSGKKYKKCCL